MADLMIKKAFVEKMWPVADDEYKRSGIWPHIAITQAAHESDWGRSGLTAKANNLFGFTGETWQKEGKSVIVLSTSEYVNGEWIKVPRPFRSYGSWAESIRDWAKLLQFPRYKFAYDFAKRGEVANFAKAVADAGYATDPSYAGLLVGVYEGMRNLLPAIEDFL